MRGSKHINQQDFQEKMTLLIALAPKYDWTFEGSEKELGRVTLKDHNGTHVMHIYTANMSVSVQRSTEVARVFQRRSWQFIEQLLSNPFCV